MILPGQTEERSLKSLRQLAQEYNIKVKLNMGGRPDHYESKEYSWFINKDMIPYFGDGKLHTFKCEQKPRMVNPLYGYTHKGPCGYTYNNYWFVEKDHLEPELFEI